MTTYTRETSDPIKVTVAVSIEIAGISDEVVAEALTASVKDLLNV